MLDRDLDYTPIYEKARTFAKRYSSEIKVMDDCKESISENGKDYACVELSFPAKGNKKLLEKLLESGVCTRMQGEIIDGKHYIYVLLWIEPTTLEYHNIEG